MISESWRWLPYTIACTVLFEIFASDGLGIGTARCCVPAYYLILQIFGYYAWLKVAWLNNVYEYELTDDELIVRTSESYKQSLKWNGVMSRSQSNLAYILSSPGIRMIVLKKALSEAGLDEEFRRLAGYPSS